jgi:hypothetical protein
MEFDVYFRYAINTLLKSFQTKVYTVKEVLRTG